MQQLIITFSTSQSNNQLNWLSPLLNLFSDLHDQLSPPLFSLTNRFAERVYSQEITEVIQGV